MHPIEIEECLKSMEIIVDTREQPSKRAEQRYKQFGVPHERHTLNYADYTFNATLPDGRKIHDLNSDTSICGSVVIERKMSLDELSGNLCQDRETFEKEFTRAREHGAKIYLLVEDATFEKLYAWRYRTKFHPNAFTAALFSICAKYNISPIFCKHEMSGKIIHDILFRELKEELRSGKYG